MAQLVARDFCAPYSLRNKIMEHERFLLLSLSRTMILLDFGNGSFSSKTLIDKLAIKGETFNTYVHSYSPMLDLALLVGTYIYK